MSEKYESEYEIWQLGDYANWEICQIHLATEIKFQFEFALIISRVDYWNEECNQHAMN